MNARLEARVWIECDSHPRLLALCARWEELFGGQMAIPDAYGLLVTFVLGSQP